jgi:anti-sigma regulatory factor (Ser/Thr protein kinase)
MHKPGKEILSLDIPCDHDAPSTVRAALGRVNSRAWAMGGVMLIASELVSNAVLHSGCLHQHMLKIRASATRDRITISVHDPGVSGQRAQPRTEQNTGGGWGLRLVDQLATRWGAQRENGYHVWAEVALAS